MVVGQKRRGKNALLNTFINYLFGIIYKDNFRYNIIYENFWKSQSNSLTFEVTIYKIKCQDRTIIQSIDSANQKYIFSCILDLFRDDVKSNFI